MSTVVLRPRDVLLAPRPITINHPGNIRLNNIIYSLQQAFSVIPKNKRKQKTDFFNRIVREVEEGGTRFLVPDGSGYALASPLTAKNAVKQRIQRPCKRVFRFVSDAALAGNEESASAADDDRAEGGIVQESNVERALGRISNDGGYDGGDDGLEDEDDEDADEGKIVEPHEDVGGIIDDDDEGIAAPPLGNDDVGGIFNDDDEGGIIDPPLDDDDGGFFSSMMRGGLTTGGGSSHRHTSHHHMTTTKKG